MILTEFLKVFSPSLLLVMPLLIHTLERQTHMQMKMCMYMNHFCFQNYLLLNSQQASPSDSILHKVGLSGHVCHSRFFILVLKTVPSIQ